MSNRWPVGAGRRDNNSRVGVAGGSPPPPPPTSGLRLFVGRFHRGGCRSWGYDITRVHHCYPIMAMNVGLCQRKRAYDGDMRTRGIRVRWA